MKTPQTSCKRQVGIGWLNKLSVEAYAWSVFTSNSEEIDRRFQLRKRFRSSAELFI